MPELPEVETVVRRIRPALEARRIERFEVIDPRWCAPREPGALEAEVNGQQVVETGRRGKYILLTLARGSTLVMHLRMTGTILIDPVEEPAHVRARFEMDDGTLIVFNDPRRFGTGSLLATDGLGEWFRSRLGLEPFDRRFTPEHLFELTRSRRMPLKSFLLDQRLIAGIGNIYADESMFRAGLHPLRIPAGLSRDDAAALKSAIVESLTQGIEAGGATIGDFRNPEGAWGAYQSEFLVHRREGLPCPDCGERISRIRVVGRSTYFCAGCQKRGASVRRK